MHYRLHLGYRMFLHKPPKITDQANGIVAFSISWMKMFGYMSLHACYGILYLGLENWMLMSANNYKFGIDYNIVIALEIETRN